MGGPSRLPHCRWCQALRLRLNQEEGTHVPDGSPVPEAPPDPVQALGSLLQNFSEHALCSKLPPFMLRLSIKYAIKINCSYLFFIFFNVTPRKYTIMYMACIKFLLDLIFLQVALLYLTL